MKLSVLDGCSWPIILARAVSGSHVTVKMSDGHEVAGVITNVDLMRSGELTVQEECDGGCDVGRHGHDSDCPGNRDPWIVDLDDIEELIYS